MSAEVLSLARSGTWSGRAHSGYNVSLRDGKLLSEDSVLPSICGTDSIAANDGIGEKAGLGNAQELDMALAPAPDHSADLANIWASGSGTDSIAANNVADVWSSASDNDEEVKMPDERSLQAASERRLAGFVEDWSSDTRSQSDSSSLSYNSQMMVLPSCISFRVPSNKLLIFYDDPFHFSDLSDANSSRAHRYGPEDFSHLADNMFEEDSSEE